MPKSKVKLLIVDDELPIRTSLSQIFTEFQYVVRSAEDGVSALREIGQATPDIILSDLNMSGMSGFELLSEVRGRFPMIRVIAMSGAFSGDSIPSGVAADAFYEKGTGLSALLKIMETVTRPEWFPSRQESEPGQSHSKQVGPAPV
jgi:DNA-binding NtrC family response regulator